MIAPLLSRSANRATAIVLAALVVSLPCERILFSLGPLRISNLEILGAAVLLTLAIRGFLEREIVRGRLFVAAFCFIGALWASALLQQFYRANAVKFSLRMLAGFLLAWCIAGLVGRDRRWLGFILALFAVSGFLSATLAGIEWAAPQYASRWYWLFERQYWVGDLNRLSGTFDYPNTAASFFLFCLGASLSLGVGGRKLFRAVSLVLCIALVLTFSRGALLAAIIMLVGVAVLVWSRRWPVSGGHSVHKPVALELLAWVGLLALLFAAALGWSSHLPRRNVTSSGATAVIDTNSLLTRTQPGFDAVGRADLWKAAWRLFVEHPWIGVGPDNYRWHYEMALGRPTRFTHIYANNLYLEILAGAGLIGLGTFTLFLFFLMSKLPAAHLGVQVALSAFLLHGIVDYFLEFSVIYLSFWIFVGLAAAPAATADSEGGNSRL